MNKVIDKGFRSCRFVSTIMKHPVDILHIHIHYHFSIFYWMLVGGPSSVKLFPLAQRSGTCGSFDDGIWLPWYVLNTIVTHEIFLQFSYKAIRNTMQHQKSH